MKITKRLGLLSAAVLAFTCISADLPAQAANLPQAQNTAQDYTDGAWTYELVDGGVWLTDYNAAAAPLGDTFVIPSEIGGKPVVQIGACGDADMILSGFLILDSTKKNVVKLVLPDTITEIGKETFKNFESLKEVKLPSNLQIIGSGAFAHCYALESIEIPDSVTTIRGSAFTCCESLKSIRLPKNLSTLGTAAFSLCTALEEVIVNDGLSTLPDDLFLGCTQLKKVVIPASVTQIAGFLFPIFNMDSIVIYGAAGSAAERYAKSYGISFVELSEPETPETPVTDPAVTKGDLDGSGEVGVDDAQTVLSAYVKGMTGSDTGLTVEQTAAADVDGDGEITITDAQLILNYYVQNTILGANITWDDLLG